MPLAWLLMERLRRSKAPWTNTFSLIELLLTFDAELLQSFLLQSESSAAPTGERRPEPHRRVPAASSKFLSCSCRAALHSVCSRTERFSWILLFSLCAKYKDLVLKTPTWVKAFWPRHRFLLLSSWRNGALLFGSAGPELDVVGSSEALDTVLQLVGGGGLAVQIPTFPWSLKLNWSWWSRQHLQWLQQPGRCWQVIC